MPIMPKDSMPMGDEMPPGDDEMVEESATTATIPAAILAGQTANPGDTLQLEVVSVDEATGDVVVKYPKPKEEPQAKGVDALAAAFD